MTGPKENQIEAELCRAWLAERAQTVVAEWAWEELVDQNYDLEALKDDDEAIFLYLSAWLGDLGYDIERLRIDERYRILATAREWLRASGHDADLIMPNDPDGCRRRVKR